MDRVALHDTNGYWQCPSCLLTGFTPDNKPKIEWQRGQQLALTYSKCRVTYQESGQFSFLVIFENHCVAHKKNWVVQNLITPIHVPHKLNWSGKIADVDFCWKAQSLKKMTFLHEQSRTGFGKLIAIILGPPRIPSSETENSTLLLVVSGLSLASSSS